MREGGREGGRGSKGERAIEAGNERKGTGAEDRQREIRRERERGDLSPGWYKKASERERREAGRWGDGLS